MKVLQGLIKFTLHLQGDGEIRVRFVVFGVDLKRASVMLDRLFSITLSKKYVSQVVMGNGIVRVDRNGLSIVADPLLQFVRGADTRPRLL